MYSSHDFQGTTEQSLVVVPYIFIVIMENIPTEDLINELEHRVDCSKRRGVRTILIGEMQ